MFIVKLLNDHKCQIQGTGEKQRTFLYIDDAVRAFEYILEKGKIGETYDISPKSQISIFKLASAIIDIIKPGDDHDKWIDYIHDRNFNNDCCIISTDKLKSLGWTQEIPFKVGLQRTIDWYRDNYTRFQI